MPWDKFSGGNSSFAAQFMRTTVAKIKGGGGGGIPNAIVTPGNPIFIHPWDDYSEPYDDTTNWDKNAALNSAGQTKIDTSAVAAKYGWAPYGAYSGAPNVCPTAMKFGKGTDNNRGFAYKGFANAGLQFDLTQGIRLQLCGGTIVESYDVWDHTMYIGLHSSKSAALNDDRVGVYYGIRAGWDSTSNMYESVGGVTNNGPIGVWKWQPSGSTGSGLWWFYSLEIPPNGVGDCTAKMENITPTLAASKSYTFQLQNERTNSDTNPLDSFWFMGWQRQGYPYIYHHQVNYVWLGTVSDDWPV